jgi:preprotein translocase subunit YajC
MNGLISDAFAQGAPSGPGGQFGFILTMVTFVVIFYFLLIRPQQKKAKEHQALISKVGVGDEVVTTGGILGKVTEVGDSFITIQVDENVHLKVQKFQVGSLMPKGTLKSA